jgi:drug/metabolite transporter (DMT)-like permease
VAIVDCLYSPFIIILSTLWLRERLSAVQLLGAGLIVSAVIIATQRKRVRDIGQKELFLGVLLGVLALVSIAVSIVMIKPLLERSPLLWVTEIRLFGGCLALIAVLSIHPARHSIISSLFVSRSWKYTITGSFFGAYLATVLWLGGMKFAQASVASALNQTSNIFLFVLAAIFLREPLYWQRVIGILIAISGALLITFG